jgi:hypothetical protein
MSEAPVAMGVRIDSEADERATPSTFNRVATYAGTRIITLPILLLFGHRPAQDGHRAMVWSKDIEYHADGGGLASAVRAEQAKALALCHIKRYVNYGMGIAK